jgi:hypothetical protein
MNSWILLKTGILSTCQLSEIDCTLLNLVYAELTEMHGQIYRRWIYTPIEENMFCKRRRVVYESRPPDY